MNRKLITILGIVFLVGIIYWLLTRSSAQKEADAQKVKELQEGFFASTNIENPTKITDDMTPEEKAVALAQIEAEKEAAAQLATLKAEYYTLYGSTAPANATVATLDYAIKTKREFNDMVQTYVRITGDTNTADNNFENILDVQNAINAYEVNQSNLLADKEASWKNRSSSIGAVVNQFATDFVTDGTALSPRDWNKNIALVLNTFSDGDLVYAERVFASLGIEHKTTWWIDRKTKFGSMEQALDSAISNSRKNIGAYATLRGRLKVLNQKYPLASPEFFVNKYGELIR